MITVQRLTKTIGSRSVLRDLSLTAGEGRVTGFLGPHDVERRAA
jgi:ABC-type multidrug transport system ATPase subunit